MIFPDRKIVERVKAEYPPGTRVRLIQMNDPYTKIPPGTEGTVKVVDDTATIHVNWDNGSGLGIVYGEDRAERI